jgi:peptide/nickel transport system permease protein
VTAVPAATPAASPTAGTPAGLPAGVPVPGRRIRPPRSPKLVVGLVLIGLLVGFGLVGPLLMTDVNRVTGDLLLPPSGRHLLGTTQAGQDVLGQLAQATRGSLLIGALVGVIATVLSVLMGVVGGYLGGRTDELMSLVVNVVLVIPGLPLAFIVLDYLRGRGVLTIVVVVAITSWAASARVLRAQTLSLRNRDYIAAARASGERAWRIIAVEVMPNLLPVVASQFIWAVVLAILTEAGLSFLGLGGIDTLTWGTMLFFAQNAQALQLGAWWWFVPPGLCIALLGCGLSLVNFSLDEVINPQLRVRRPGRSS